MKDSKILCDGCGADITYTGNSVDYLLVLSNASKPLHPSVHVVTDVMIAPQIKRACHFCGLGCLDTWRAREKFKDSLWAAFYDACILSRNGNCTSYRAVTKDERDAQSKAIDAKALEAYPLHKRNR